MVRRGPLVIAISTAIAVGVASLPLGVASGNSFFGLGSVLLVPALAIGVWFALGTQGGERRAWWFGFTMAVGLCLPLAPAIEASLCDFAVFLQRRTQRGELSLSQRVIEPGCLLLTVLCPVAVACLAGLVAGGFAQRLARRAAGDEAACSPRSARWQFSLRELLLVLGALGVLLAWNGLYTADRGARERQNQQQFLARFKDSFKSGEVKLLAAPGIEERQGALMSGFSFKPPGVNEYRVTAQIEKDGVRRWAVWAYTCNQDEGEMIYQYAYAEAEREDQLPPSPLPTKRYIEGAWVMVDGAPSTAGPSAVLVSVVPPSRLGQPLVLTARAPTGTICELHVFPRTAATSSLGAKSPDKNGLVRWAWTPEFSSPLQYELRCIENRPSGQMMSQLRGSIPSASAASR